MGSGALALFVLVGCGGVDGGGDDPARTSSEKSGYALVLTPQESGITALLQAVSPVSPAIVWVSGHDGTFARSTDGGESWRVSVMEGEETLEFRDLAAFDSLNAFLMSAGPGALSRIYRTRDGGRSWDLQYQADHPEAFLDCMAFWDRERGLAYGDAIDQAPFILRTVDGGEEWTRVPAANLPRALEGEGGFAASGSCLIAGPDGRAWIGTGAGPRARVLRSADWGEWWEEVVVPMVGGEMSGLTTLSILDDGRGFALGGTIGGDSLRTENVAVTTDFGRSWRPGFPPIMLGPVYGSGLVELAGSPILVAVGPGGLNWSSGMEPVWTEADSATYWAVAFHSAEAGWAVGPDGKITHLAFRAGGDAQNAR